MSTGFDWAIVLDVGVGVGVFIAGVAIFIAMSALAKTLTRLNRTLDGVDAQLTALGTPVSKTLGHVGGIADTADQTVARLGNVASMLERIAESLGRTVTLAQEAITPAIVNTGATLGGISAGLRRLVLGREE